VFSDSKRQEKKSRYETCPQNQSPNNFSVLAVFFFYIFISKYLNFAEFS
jgi:hypothetical protein